MVTLDQLAQVALERDNLLLRATLSELLREEPIATKWASPDERRLKCAGNRGVAF